MDDYIDLERRFIPYRDEADPARSADESYLAGFQGKPGDSSWADLLTHPRVVILGEPGSGKTWELKAQSHILAGAGQSSFYLDLKRLVAEPIQSILGPDLADPFHRWRRGAGIGYFFLDAVDESKLQSPHDFHRALDRFGKDLGLSALARAHVLLSSRISEWRPITDRNATRAALPLPLAGTRQGNADQGADDDAKSVSPLIFRLAPLDAVRVEILVRHLGLADSGAFTSALDRHHASTFTRRPLDVAGLVAFWIKEGRLGSLRELIEYDLEMHLRERPERPPDGLTPELARRGAETLAAACILCRETNIRVPDERRDGIGNAIEAADCLPPGWQPAWVGALLQRGIFDDAIYGRMRFHHRRVTEYLAAQWLTRRIKEGLDLPALEELLFTEVDGTWVLRPSLAPTAAWLLLGGEPWRLELRARVLESAPELIFQHGDPKDLLLAFKREALMRLAEQFRGRESLRLGLDAETLSRVAEPGLSGEVSGLLRDAGLCEDFRFEMLQLVVHGRLVDCVDAALDLIEEATVSAVLKSSAARTVRFCGTREHKRRLVRIADAMEMIPSELCAHICEAIYPDAVDATGMVALLQKAGEVPPWTTGLPYYLVQHLKSLDRAYDAVPFIAGLTALGRSRPWIAPDKKRKSFSARFYWVAKPLLQALSDLLAGERLGERAVTVAAEALECLDRYWGHQEIRLEPPADHARRLAHHFQVRRRYTWNRIAELRGSGKAQEPRLHDVFRGSALISSDAADFDWLLADLAAAGDRDDRGIALHLAILYWTRSGRRWRGLHRLWRATDGNPDLRHALLTRREVRPWYPLLGLWYRHIRYNLLEGWWWSRRGYELRWAVSGLWDRVRPLMHLRGLYSGRLVYQLAGLAMEAHKDPNSRDRWAANDWPALAEKRGRLVARAVRSCCIRSWRSYAPRLVHEEPAGHGTDRRIIVGLSALETLWVDGRLDPSRFSEAEAQIAARYGFRELNGFPPWFPALVEHWPEVIRPLLLSAIAAEWQTPSDQQEVYGEIMQLGRSGQYLLPLVADAMFERLESGDPAHVQVLAHVLEVLTECQWDRRIRFAALALRRAPDCEGDLPRYLLWLRLGLQIDAGRTLDYLDQALPVGEQADEIVVGLSGGLEEQHYHEGPRLPEPDYLRLAHLRRLIPLVYRHVRPVNDIDHADGHMHRAKARDDAQTFRSSLLARLASQEDPGAIEALRQLLEEPDLAGQRDWIRHLLDQRIELAAERPPWTAKTLREYAAAFEYAPRTAYELFRLAISRFADIKRSVELARISARGDLHRDDDEATLRSWLARQLIQFSRNRYTVPQEEEIDRKKRPDLHLEVPGLPPLPIEIKWADGTYDAPNELLERLENQLIGDYLRAYDARFGIFLIGCRGKKGYWIDPGSKRHLDLEGLRLLLQERADCLARERAEVDAVQVVAIDFSRPD